jgi:hypothetical protein
MTTFQVGQTYNTPDGIYTIQRRTDKTVWLETEDNTIIQKRVKVEFDREYIVIDLLTVRALVPNVKTDTDKINLDKSTDIKIQIIGILINPEIMDKLAMIENIENIDKIRTLRPHPAKTWKAWLEFALTHYTPNRLMDECPKLIDKAYSLTQNL